MVLKTFGKYVAIKIEGAETTDYPIALAITDEYIVLAPEQLKMAK